MLNIKTVDASLVEIKLFGLNLFGDNRAFMFPLEIRTDRTFPVLPVYRIY